LAAIAAGAFQAGAIVASRQPPPEGVDPKDFYQIVRLATAIAEKERDGADPAAIADDLYRLARLSGRAFAAPAVRQAG
jgi:hypothetical protein